MTPWNLAIGNLKADNPAPPVPAAMKKAEPVTRKKVSPTFCPCCGKRMRSPDGPRPWTPEEDEILRAGVARSRKHEAIASELGRPVSSIKSRIATLASKEGQP